MNLILEIFFIIAISIFSIMVLATIIAGILVLLNIYKEEKKENEKR